MGNAPSYMVTLAADADVALAVAAPVSTPPPAAADVAPAVAASTVSTPPPPSDADVTPAGAAAFAPPPPPAAAARSSDGTCAAPPTAAASTGGHTVPPSAPAPARVCVQRADAAAAAQSFRLHELDSMLPVLGGEGWVVVLRSASARRAVVVAGGTPPTSGGALLELGSVVGEETWDAAAVVFVVRGGRLVVRDAPSLCLTLRADGTACLAKVDAADAARQVVALRRRTAPV